MRGRHLAASIVDKTRVTGSGSRIQRVRLWSGLVLFVYVLLHYLNHSAGHISLAAMESILRLQSAIWGSLPGQILLYGALLTHVTLGLARMLNLRTWRRPFWEWAQVIFGLAIPWFLISHIVFTRASETILGLDVDYKHELALLWPDVWISQSLLLVIVWLHACIGLHFWLRLRAGYARVFPILAGVAVLVPTTALTGWITAARREFDALQRAAAASPDSVRAAAEQEAASNAIRDILRGVESVAQLTVLAIIAVVLLFMATRWLLQRFRSKVRLTYGDGTVAVCSPGHTILEISRAYRIPHMSVCGGRARCSTCRTLIVSGLENLAPQTEAESLLLRKLNAAPGVRLACQARVRGDAQVRPLIQPGSNIHAARSLDPLGWGVEREIAVMFLDIRGFSKISEKSLPYDVVFILNSLFGEIGAEIEAANGYIDKFMGDGLMALFGLASSAGEASRDALRAAIAAQNATAKSSRMLTQHISEPIRIGIGIHTGPAVVGRIGRTSDQTTPSRLTAIGDTVNIAARLESATKELGVGIVISAATVRVAELKLSDAVGARKSISVHNISAPVDVVAVEDIAALAHDMGGSAELRRERSAAPGLRERLLGRNQAARAEN